MTLGGLVNIGIVFNEQHSLVDTIGDMKAFLQHKGCRLVSVKFSEDIDGENWVEIDIHDNKLDDSFLDGYYMSVELSGSIFDSMTDEIATTLRIEKESNYHGYLFSINWGDLFPDENNELEIRHTRQKIVGTLIELYQTISYSYAFVGHEIEIELDPEEFARTIADNHSYPVAMVRAEGGLDLYYGSTGIDGFSKEVPRKESISL
ncbi:Imm64 family immunity protein [Bacillus suaedae]|uniref:Uncharacterized protein n=1 Tax=Halalkalibacter suaedae TaxID=2822140 RepID=A0A941AM94_9BACI|nr:Imm64 family immunity protein [Bacillus suaedae]MBP3950260.1 hypothetical protein [Bacillus suaedae]